MIGQTLGGVQTRDFALSRHTQYKHLIRRPAWLQSILYPYPHQNMSTPIRRDNSIVVYAIAAFDYLVGRADASRSRLNAARCLFAINHSLRIGGFRFGVRLQGNARGAGDAAIARTERDPSSSAVAMRDCSLSSSHLFGA